METLSDAKANWHGQTSEPLWRLSWSKLRSEQYCANITWKHFTVVLFTSFLPSLFDFGTDYLSGVNFLSGTNYTKYVNHGSDLEPALTPAVTQVLLDQDLRFSTKRYRALKLTEFGVTLPLGSLFYLDFVLPGGQELKP